MSVLQKLTEGIVNRDLAKEGDALLSKWEKTGLLEGLTGDAQRQGMARLLENQAKQLLKEASSMAGGDVEGFASVAFPLVRRVFGGLLANDLVSVQPMSLPSGLIFFLDFTTANTRFGSDADDSIYGGGVVGQALTGGVDLGEEDPTSSTIAGSGAEESFYSLNSGYSSPTGTLILTSANGAENTRVVACSGTIASGGFAAFGAALAAPELLNAGGEAWKKAIDYDADLLAFSTSGETDKVFQVDMYVGDHIGKFNFDNLHSFALKPCLAGAAAGAVSSSATAFGLTGDEYIHQVRRLTKRISKDYLRFTFIGGTNATLSDVTRPNGAHSTNLNIWALDFPYADQFTTGNGLGSVKGTVTWGLEGADNTGTAEYDSVERDVIPEIDIKVDSVAVTAITKKLKAKWTPELGQDLNAYHNLDAEVELTSVLSEHIALEIDREIVKDLVSGARAGTYYWSRSPGLFLHRSNGTEVGQSSAAPDFTGTVSEWYETLVETINDVSAQIHRKTLRGGANFIVVSPEVASILEFTSGFRASLTVDDNKGTVGAVKAGSISKKWDVYIDPYFPRNIVLVGRKGGSFLESGYVYAPYVPLQVTPTIFGPEDFTPRKGVMTRYAKKMVRPDMYGLVIIRGLLNEAGSTGS